MSAFENARKFFEACETPAGNDDDKVDKMVKVWNAPWAMKELGWM
jgi:hypothetical protein